MKKGKKITQITKDKTKAITDLTVMYPKTLKNPNDLASGYRK